MGPIFNNQNWKTSPFLLYPNKGNYMWKDMERLAIKFDLSYKQPEHFPQNGLLAARVAVAGESEEWAGKFIKEVFILEFEEGADISNESTIGEALMRAGAPAERWLEAANEEFNKQKLRQRTNSAMELGLFGAPTFKVSDEIFWGNDRLEDALNFTDAGQVVDIKKFCNEWLSSWSGNDPEKLIQFYTDDAYYSDPARPSGLHGREQILNYLTKLLSKFPDWVWEAHEIFPNEQGFTLKWKATVTYSGGSKTFFGMDIVELKGNKIHRNEVYFDPSNLNRSAYR